MVSTLPHTHHKSLSCPGSGSCSVLLGSRGYWIPCTCTCTPELPTTQPTKCTAWVYLRERVGGRGRERERDRDRERQRERDRERQREKDGCVVLRVWCVGERAQSRDVDRVCVRVCKRERKEVRDKLDTFEPNVTYT